MHSNTKLQIAAVVCILNLIWRNDEGSADRQSRLKEIGWGGVYSFPSRFNILNHHLRVFKILHQLLTTSDSNLFEKVKLALQQLTMWQVYRLLLYAPTVLEFQILRWLRKLLIMKKLRTERLCWRLVIKLISCSFEPWWHYILLDAAMSLIISICM